MYSTGKARSPGVGGFTNQQGSESVSGANVTDFLTGVITGSTDSGLSSGTYDLVTTYSGPSIGSDGTEIQSQSNPSNLNYFYYTFFDPSVDMTLYLTGTPTGSHLIPLVTNGAFDAPNFSFLYVTANCSGVAVCSQNNVGLTPSASQYGPVDTRVSYTTTNTVPEPAPGPLYCWARASWAAPCASVAR